MDVYKDFIQNLRRKTFEEVHIMLCDVSPKLTEYVRLLTEVKFQDGSYHTFYGDVKRIISSFMNYFNQTIDEVIKDADKCSNDINKDKLMALLDQTICTHQSNQLDFCNDFLPITSTPEKLAFKDIEVQYKNYMKKMYEFREKLDQQLQKQDLVDEFVKDHFEIAVRNTSEIFNYCNVFLVLMLVECLNKIRTSLEEILLRMSNNLRRVQEECDESLNSLLHQLYDKNKESLNVCRAHTRCSVDIAEVNRGIQIIRNKIENFETEVPLARLEEEVTYWQNRLKDFNEVAVNVVKIKAELDNVKKEEEIYNSMRSAELPGTKRCCWLHMGVTFNEQRKYLEEKLKEEAKALFTFFACRGTDRIIYTDNIGPHYVDEFNHKVYVFDYGLGIYHVSCDETLEQPLEFEYYFDKYGRYIIRDGIKLYQCAPCTNLYKLGDDGLLTKVNDDEKEIKDDPNAAARVSTRILNWMEIRNPNNIAVLPNLEPMDITSTMDNETVKYLWDCFGNILPDVLHDVGKEKSKNPIHYLAHKLLFYKYNKTLKERRIKKIEAEEFRTNIFKERKEKAVAITKAWKSKLVKRRKPEESDDTQERAVYDAQKAQEAFINSLNYYY